MREQELDACLVGNVLDEDVDALGLEGPATGKRSAGNDANVGDGVEDLREAAPDDRRIGEHGGAPEKTQHEPCKLRRLPAL